MTVTILLVDDHKVLLEGLEQVLASQPDMEVVGQAQTGSEAVSLAASLSPHVVVMDVTMPHLNGIEATRQIRAQHPRVRVIGLSMHPDRHYLEAMMEAGASGYVLKHCAGEELVHAVRAVSRGKTYLTPEAAGTMVDAYLRQRQEHPRFSAHHLTSREREVLQRIADGESTREIAAHLNVSVKTVETYRRQIMGKLRISSIAALTKYAIREGLTTL